MTTAAFPARIICRRIGTEDLEAVIALLRRGFPGRSLSYWRRGLAHMSERPVPVGCPRYGFLLEADGVLRGVLIAIYAQGAGAEPGTVRCNLASWFVEPAFRPYASQLAAVATNRKDVTYINISPARHTWANIEAQGFHRFSDGLFFAVPVLSAARRQARVHVIKPGLSVAAGAAIEPADRALLETHAHYGCLSLAVEDGNRLSPFVFLPLRVWRGRVPVPAFHLLYCRNQREFIDHAGVLGVALLQRGAPLAVLDACGPVDGLHGFYRANRRPKYTRGAGDPRLGNLADTEYALFGA